MKTSDDYKPQRETRNALAIFAGYENWSAFRIEKEPLINQTEYRSGKTSNDNVANPSAVEASYRRPSLIKSKKGVLLLVLLVFISFGIFLFPSIQENWGYDNLKDVNFSLDKEADTIPFNIVAKYYLGPKPKAGYYLNQDPLNPSTGTLTIGINEPQFSWLTLRFGETRIKSLPFHAISKEWVGFYQGLRRKTKYPLEPKDFMENGFAHLKPSYFAGKNLDSLGFNFYLKKAQNFNVSIDEMEFETRIFVPNPDGFYKGFYVKFTGDSGQIELATFPKGCANHNNIFLPGNYQLGRDNDLSQMELPANEWLKFSVKTSHKKAEFFINGRLNRSVIYPKKGGLLKALSLQFNTRARIDYIYLKNLKGEWIEKEDF